MPLLLIGIILCALKIAGVTLVATWPWWLVTLPFWIGIAAVIAMLIVGGSLLGLFVGIVSWWERK